MENYLMTISEFCKATSLGRTYVYKLLKQGDLKAVKIGRRTLVRKDDLAAWTSSLEAYPTASKE